MHPADPSIDNQQAVIPDFIIDSMARCLLPQVQAYFASAEGQAAFEVWKRQQEHTYTGTAPVN